MHVYELIYNTDCISVSAVEKLTRINQENWPEWANLCQPDRDVAGHNDKWIKQLTVCFRRHLTAVKLLTG